jgi:anti-sigma regulatory factor (Ser/Thr protein kinase)
MTAMHWVGGRTHAAFPMSDGSRVGEARRHASQLASEIGLDETAAGRLAIIVTELGNNLVHHADRGHLLLAGDVKEREVEVIAVDRGPGIADVGRSMNDGFSTGGTPGTGLGAVRRLSQDFDLHSVLGEGTIVVARVRAQPAARKVSLHVAGICVPIPGERVCGDAWGAWVGAASLDLLLADGLGHGTAAAEASMAAVAALEQAPGAPPLAVLEAAHRDLRSTRGAALAFLHGDTARGTVSCCGAGNVIARVVSGIAERMLLTQHGTVGLQMRRPEEAVVDWPEHSILVVHSDGIESRWTTQRVVPALLKDPAVIAAILWRDHTRGRDDATVVVAKRVRA